MLSPWIAQLDDCNLALIRLALIRRLDCRTRHDADPGARRHQSCDGPVPDI
jgi:hypothetical protein